MTRFTTTAAAVLMCTVLISGAAAQLGFGPEPTFIEGADVWIDGELVKGCNVVFAGKKIKEVGPGIAKPDGARVIDGKGKTIVPVFIDASSTLGLVGEASNQAHHRSIDRADPFAEEIYRDALEAGVAYVYLRNAASSGIGGQGVGIRVPDKSVTTLDDLELEATGTIHVAVGSKSNALGRVTEIDSLGKALEAAKKYRESWTKYEEDLGKYTEELAEWSKKNKKDDKDSSGKKGDDKKKKNAWGPDEPVVDDHEHEHEQADEHEHGEEIADEHDHGRDDHEHGHDASDPYAGAPGFALELKRLLSQPSGRGELSPRPSFVDDGTEPHLRWENDPRPARGGLDLSNTEIAVCPHCSGIYDRSDSDQHEHEHDHGAGFDFFEFAPEEKKDEKAAAKDDKKKDGKPKLPREPAVDPAKSAVADALEGKLRVRITVHRAEDILAVLELLETYPMNVALEGVTEGWRVAEQIAKAGVTVVLHAEPVTPRQESGAGGGNDFPFEFPFPFPFPFPFDIGGGGPEGEPLHGIADARNAAILNRAGVPVVVASVDKPAEATPLLALSAAFAAGHGLPRGAAIKALTTHAAEVLGLGDRLGSITSGHLASFLVLDGDPFAPTTSVERVYVDGERIYRKK